jgi:putative flippase GtrA
VGERKRLLGESGKFAVVGIVSTIVSVLTFNLLVHGYWFIDEAPLRDHAIIAYVIASFAGMVVSYRGSRSWVFRHREPTHPDGGRSAFLVINVVTMLLPIGCLWFTRNALGLEDPLSDNISANVVGLFLGFVARFFLFRRFVFRDRDADEVPEFYRRAEELAEGYLHVGANARTSAGPDPAAPRRTRSEESDRRSQSPGTE